MEISNSLSELLLNFDSTIARVDLIRIKYLKLKINEFCRVKLAILEPLDDVNKGRESNISVFEE